jgi:hypothetical protein
MDAFFWVALAVFVLSGIGGIAFVVARGRQTWHAFVSFAAAGAAGAERLIAHAEHLAARGEEAASRLQELQAAVERLQRAQARARILLAATGEVTSLLRLVRTFVPQK